MINFRCRCSRSVSGLRTRRIYLRYISIPVGYDTRTEVRNGVRLIHDESARVMRAFIERRTLLTRETERRPRIRVRVHRAVVILPRRLVLPRRGGGSSLSTARQGNLRIPLARRRTRYESVTGQLVYVSIYFREFRDALSSFL